MSELQYQLAANPERPLPVATVEIFYDADVPREDIDIQPMYEGLNMVQAITGGLEVVRDTRKLRLANEDGVINVSKIRWPRFETDFALVATANPITASKKMEGLQSEKSPTGMAVQVRGLKVAVVDMVHPRFPATVTAHEVGHLFGLKRAGVGVQYLAEEEGHCSKTDCLMYPVSDVRITRTPEPIKGGMSLYRMLAGKSKVDTTIQEANDCFCEECTQLLKAASTKIALQKIS